MDSRRRKSFSHSRKKQRSRGLLFEPLEDRRLLAVDWRNPVNSLDVSGDGFISPLDALQPINELNDNGPHALTDQRPGDKPYWDASGDQFISPLDALQVINALNDNRIVPYVLGDGQQIAAEQNVTITVGQTSGTRTYRLQVTSNFDTTDATASSDDQFAIYLVDPQQPATTLLDRGTPGTTLFTLTESGAEFAPGRVRWDGEIVEIDLSELTGRDTAELRLQLLNTDGDRGSRVAVRPLTNEVDANGVIGPKLLDTTMPAAAGAAVNLTSLTAASDVNVQVENVRFSSVTQRYTAELRLQNTGNSLGRSVAVAFPDLPSGVTLRNPSGTTADGDPYINFAPAISRGGLSQNGRSEPLLVEFDDPTRVPFALTPQILAGTNQPPTLAAIGPLTVMPGGQLATQLTAVDPNGDTVTFSLGATGSASAASLDLPTGILRANGVLEFTPEPDQLGSYTFDVIASDGALEARQTVTLDVVADPLTTTRVSGFILDVDQSPLAGMHVEVGAVQGLTLSDGSFTLDLGSGPVVGDTLKVRGELFPGPLVYPFIAEKLAFILEHDVFSGVNNVIARPIFLPPLDVAGGTEIDPMQDTTVSQEVAPGETAEVFVKAGTLMNQQGTPFTGTLSITEVPRDLTPAALPDNLVPDLVVTIQPGEMVFATPAPLTLPNRAGWAPGTIMDLWSINPVSGEFDDVGDGKVSPDGTTVETTSGGIRNSSWHDFVPRPPKPKVKNKKACDDCEKESQATSEVDNFTGELKETHSMPTYESLGQARGVVLTYQSLRADPRPILQVAFDDVDTSGLQNPDDLRLTARVKIDLHGVKVILPGFVSFESAGIPIGTNFWGVPAGSGPLAASLQADLRSEPTGVYDYSVASGFSLNTDAGLTGVSSTVEGRLAHVNSIASQFGSGWGLAGLKEIVESPNGSVLIVDGDGTELLYTTANGTDFSAPPGSFSTLTRQGNNTFRMTTKDGTVYEFNVQNKLSLVRDRNGNETSYLYDQQGQLEKIVDPVGLETLFAYADGRVSSITDPADRVLQLDYDAAGNLIRITDPDDTSRQFEYDGDHHMVGETDQRGHHEQAFYDEFGLFSNAILKDGSTMSLTPGQRQGLYRTSLTSNLRNPPLASRLGGDALNVDANGNVQRTVLDAAGQEVASRDREGNLPTIERNDQNLVTQVVDARGNVSLYTYDSRGNLLTKTDSIIAAASSGEIIGTIAQPGEVDIYTFNGTAGQILYYDSLDNDLDGIRTQLTAPSGRSILPNFFFSGDQPDFDRGPFTLPETGIYELKIGGDRFTGDYRFRLLDLADAPTLTIGQTVTGELETDLEADLFVISGTKGQHFLFDIAANESSVGQWGLTGLDGGSFGFGVFEIIDVDLEAALPADGQYLLEITRDPVNANGSRSEYSFEVKAVSDPPVVNAGFGTVHSGAIAAGEQVDFPYTGAAGTVVYFDSLLDGFSSLRGDLLDSAGNFLQGTAISRDVLGNIGGGTFTLPKSGDYTFRVRGASSTSAGDYSFRLLDVTAASVSLQINTAVTSELNPGTEADFYRIDASAGQRLYLDVLADGLPSAQLLTPTFGFTFGLTETPVNVLQTGIYSLALGDPFEPPLTPLEYGFRVLSVADATPITLDTTVSGSLEGNGGDILFRFSGTAGQSIYADALGSDSVGTWKLFSPANLEIARGFDITDDFRVTLPVDGEYVLALVGEASNQAFDYEFNIRTPSTSATALTLGELTTATIDEPGEIERFSFEGVAGQRIYYDSQRVSEFFSDRMSLQLLAPNGEQLIRFVREAGDEQEPITLPTDGTYVIEVGGDDNLGTLPFRLLDVTAVPVASGAIQGLLDPEYETDVFQIAGLAGQRLQFDVQLGASGQWALFGPGNEALAIKSLDEDFVQALPSDGTYVLSIRGTEPGTVSYQFQIVDANDIPVAQSGFGELHSGTVDPNETETFSYSGSAGGLVLFDSLDGSSSLQASFTGPGGQDVFRSGASFDSGVIILPQSGDYTFELSQGFFIDERSYSFRWFDLAADAAPMELGATIGGRLESGWETEIYRFEGSAGQVLYLDALVDFGFSFSFDPQVISPSGATTEVNPVLRLQESGTHYLLVRQSFQDAPLDYSLRLLDLASSPEATLPSALEGSLDPGMSADVFRFTGAEGQRVFLRTAGIVDVATIRLLDVSGHEVQNTDGSFRGFAATLPVDGEYYLVFDGQQSETINYSVPLARPQTSIISLATAQGGAQPVTYTYDPAFSQATSMTDELGRQTLYEIDPGNGNLLKATRGMGAVGGSDDIVRQFTYGTDGLLETVTDPRGFVTEYEYDDVGRPIRMTQAVGTADEGTQRFEYDAAGNVTSMEDELGRRTIYEYDSMNRVVRITEPDPDGTGPQSSPVTTFEYDAAGNQIAATDPLGRVTRNEYDPRHRLTKAIDAAQAATIYEYDGVGNRVAMTDRLGQITRHVFDTRNRLIKTIDAEGGSSSYKYDDDDHVTETVDQNGHRTKRDYDARGRVTRVIDPLNHTVEYQYDPANQLTAIMDQLGRTTRYAYDDAGRSITETLPDPDDSGPAPTPVVTQTYDLTGNVIAIGDPLNNVTEYVYDARDRVTEIHFPDPDGLGALTGPIHRYEYDAASQRTKYTDPLGHAITYAYDGLGRQITMTEADPDGAGPLAAPVTTAEYDLVDRVLQTTDAEQQTWQSSYDALDRLTSSTDPRGGETTMTYDAEGNLLSLEDAVGNTTSYAYDKLNRRVTETDALGHARQFEFDPVGNVTSFTDRNGRIRRYEFDPLNRRISEEWMNGTAVVHEISYSYNAAGQETQITDPFSDIEYSYDGLGRIVSIDRAAVGGQPAITIDQTWDSNSRRTRVDVLVDGSVDHSNAYTYDRLSRVTSVAQSGASVANKRVELTYNALDQFSLIERFTDLAGTQLVATSDYAYDGLNRLSQLVHRQDNSELATYAWTYDREDRLLSETSTDGTTTFGVDAIGQLVEAESFVGPIQEYAYDLNGNRTDFSTGVNNQLLSDATFDFQYDAEGNRLRQVNRASGESREFTWDFRNRLVRVADKNAAGTLLRDVAYEYDALNQRISKKIDSDGDGAAEEIERFVPEGLRMALVLGADNQVRNRYLNGPNIDQVLADEQFDATGALEQVAWPLEDHLGTIRDIAERDALSGDTSVINHLVYDSYGNVLTQSDESIGTSFTYAGRELDVETGLYYFRARSYDPLVGRFLSEDPIGFAAGDTNLYAFVQNNPVVGRDPLGLWLVARKTSTLDQYLEDLGYKPGTPEWNEAKEQGGRGCVGATQCKLGDMKNDFPDMKDCFSKPQQAINEQQKKECPCPPDKKGTKAVIITISFYDPNDGRNDSKFKTDPATGHVNMDNFADSGSKGKLGNVDYDFGWIDQQGNDYYHTHANHYDGGEHGAYPPNATRYTDFFGQKWRESGRVDEGGHYYKDPGPMDVYRDKLWNFPNDGVTQYTDFNRTVYCVVCPKGKGA